MLKIAEKHGVRYTGVVIEDYSERTSGTFPRTTDTERFRYFGGLLLEKGGEIGIHGYNHMPLCPDGFDFLGKVDYETWPTANDMRSAIAELMDFTKTLFPKNTISTYVPPSNILSAEGRAMLARAFRRSGPCPGCSSRRTMNTSRNSVSATTVLWNCPASYRVPFSTRICVGRPSTS